jgi:rhodanese-related sulfurtransferase
MTINAVLRVPPASASDARAHFAAQFAFYTDVSDVHAALRLPDPGFVLLDTRSHPGWAQGRIPGALHLPTDEIPARAPAELDPAVPVVAYCWSPACNGAARAALALAGLGYRVKEMLGGVEYWIREGFAVQTDAGLVRRPADPHTAPVAVSPIGCAC